MNYTIKTISLYDFYSKNFTEAEHEIIEVAYLVLEDTVVINTYPTVVLYNYLGFESTIAPPFTKTGEGTPYSQIILQQKKFEWLFACGYIFKSFAPNTVPSIDNRKTS